MINTLRLVLFSLIASFVLVGGSQTAAHAYVPPDTDHAVFMHYSPDLGDNRDIPIRCEWSNPNSMFELWQSQHTDRWWDYDIDQYRSCDDFGSDGEVDQVWVRDDTDLRCMKADGTWWNKWKATGWHDIVHNGFRYECIVVEDQTPGF